MQREEEALPLPLLHCCFIEPLNSKTKKQGYFKGLSPRGGESLL